MWHLLVNFYIFIFIEWERDRERGERDRQRQTQRDLEQVQTWKLNLEFQYSETKMCSKKETVLIPRSPKCANTIKSEIIPEGKNVLILPYTTFGNRVYCPVSLEKIWFLFLQLKVLQKLISKFSAFFLICCRALTVVAQLNLKLESAIFHYF